MSTIGTPRGVLMVHAVMVRLIAEGSLVEFLLYDAWKGARSELQAEYVARYYGWPGSAT